MPYEIILKCGGQSCDTAIVVPQVGAMPTGWIAIRMILPEIVTTQRPTQDSNIKAEAFCCIDCVLEYLNGRK